MASDIVLGAAEHAQGFGVITAKYRITPKGLASEVTIRNPDGFSATRSFYLRELLNPPPERIALNPNFRPVSAWQIEQQLKTESDFMNDPTVHTAAIVSLGHHEDSDRNWMYVFQRDAADKDVVRLVAIRLPDDRAEALAFRDRVLIAAGLASAIPTGSSMDRIVLRGDMPTITPQSVAAASPIGLFGIGQDELSSLGSDGFEVIQQRQAAEIEALTRHMLDQLDAADLDTVDEQLELAMQMAGRFLVSAAAAVRAVGSADYGRPDPDGRGADGGRGDAAGLEILDSDADFMGVAESEIELGIADLNDSSLTETESISVSDGILVAEGEESALAITAESTEEQNYYLSAEVEDGDEGYQPVIIEFEDLSTEADTEEEKEGDQEEATLSLLETSEGEATQEGEESEDGDVTTADSVAELLLEEQTEEDERLKELIEELGGDTSLFSAEPGEISPLGLLIADGELPAFSELGEFNELLLAAEITDAVSSDYDDDCEEDSGAEQSGASDEGVNDSGSNDSGSSEIGTSEGASSDEAAAADEVSGDEAGETSVSLAAGIDEEVDVDELATGGDSSMGDASEDDTLDLQSGSESVDGELSERESDFWPAIDGELFAAEELIEESKENGVVGLRAKHANRRRAAIRALNRMRHEAERLGIQILELIKLRQRRGLKRLWFEQLVFALAREMKFTFEQRQELARELELSSADFDDIRQAELAVRREVHARKLRTKLIEPLQNI